MIWENDPCGKGKEKGIFELLNSKCQKPLTFKLSNNEEYHHQVAKIQKLEHQSLRQGFIFYCHCMRKKEGKAKWKSKVSSRKERRNGKVGYHVERKEHMEKQDIMWKGKKKWKSRILCGKERRNGKVGYHVERKEEMEKQNIMWKKKKL